MNGNLCAIGVAVSLLRTTARNQPTSSSCCLNNARTVIANNRNWPTARGFSRCSTNKAFLLRQQQQLLRAASPVSRPTSADMSSSVPKTLTVDNMNPHIKTMEYAVRGPILIRAAEIEKELEQGVKKPFKEVIRANIGDCHSLGQQPITFIRQVLAICSFPELLKEGIFPEDVKDRAKRLLNGCKGHSVGSYSESAGVEVVRKDAANYIEKRDGYPSNYLDILLCAGASDGIRNIMKLLNYSKTGKPPGIMIPIPQYPLYTASIAEYGMHPISYYLDEDSNWALNISELKRALDESRKLCEPRALVVINPGNPTGQVLTKQNIQEIVKFAAEEKLFVFADEVYQHNIYAKDRQFHSFKKVITEMGLPYNTLELASFMSTSKGYMGECGLRGGYAEVVNMDPTVKAMLNKSISAKLCPTVLGQAALETVVNPPQPGEPSYERFQKEKEAVLSELAKRAKMVAETFNSIEGMKCNEVQGAMYAFPRIMLPEKAIEVAKKQGVEPDMFYAMRLLDETGICVVPGSGFGQKPGTYHFRTTILPPTEHLKAMLNLFRDFQQKFLKEFK